MLAMRSKSLSWCKTVSPASSAVAAMMRSGTDGAGLLTPAGEQRKDFRGPVLYRRGQIFHPASPIRAAGAARHEVLGRPGEVADFEPCDGGDPHQPRSIHFGQHFRVV